MRYHEDGDTTTLFAREVTIEDDILRIDGLEFPGRIGDDLSISIRQTDVEMVVHILDMAGNCLATVRLDDDQAGIDADFATIVAGVE